MRNAILTSYLIFFSLFSKGQTTGKYYYPDGTPVHENLPTSGDVVRFLGEEFSFYKATDLGHVVFKKLSLKPLLIHFNKKPDISKIPQMIEACKQQYQRYIDGFSYQYDIRNLMNKGQLTESYLLDSFGEPDKKEEDGEVIKWTYVKYNIDVSFIRNQAVSFMYFNNNAVTKNKFSIIDYTVNTDDYSIGFEISVFNAFDKAIKYIYITATAYNTVLDKINTKTVTAVGPLDVNDSGSYKFNNLFYTKVGYNILLKEIRIQFMDGSTKLLNESTIRQITTRIYEYEGE